MQDNTFRMEPDINESDAEYNYRELIEMQGEGIGLVDENEVFLYANPAANKIFEVETTGLIGKSLFLFLENEENQLIYKQTNLRKKGILSGYELKIITPSGNKKYLRISSTPKFDKNSKYIGAFAIFSDITQKILQERELEIYNRYLQKLVDIKTNNLRAVNEELLAEINQRKAIEKELIIIKHAVDNSISAIVLTDLKGNILYANSETANYWGFSNSNELTDLNIIDLFKNKEIAQNTIHNIITKKTYLDELEAVSKIGDSFFVIFAANTVKDSNDKVVAIMASMFDITQRKKAIMHVVRINKELKESKRDLQQALYEQESLFEGLLESKKQLDQAIAMKDRMFSIVAHDLRGPFSGFLGLTDLMYNDFDDLQEHQLKEIAFAINKSAKTLYMLIEDLLTWSRAQIGQIEFNPVNSKINLLVDISIELQKNSAKNKNIELINNIIDDIEIVCDSDMIQAVFRNLITNAIKFSFENSEIIIGYRKTLLNDIEENLFYVRDFGVGIKSENISNIFKDNTIFTTPGTNNEAGTGLGLLIVKDFIEVHNGRVWFETEENKGTTFYFTIG